MNYYINKQAVEIKARFENAPLSSPNEVCAAIGMLCKLYGLPIPGRGEMTSQMKDELLGTIKDTKAPDAFAEKLVKLLEEYYKDNPVTDEIYDLLKYSYEN